MESALLESDMDVIPALLEQTLLLWHLQFEVENENMFVGPEDPMAKDVLLQLPLWLSLRLETARLAENVTLSF